MVKIADFGLARSYAGQDSTNPLTNRVITLWYRPPELLLGTTKYGPEVDMWSVGCIFAELVMGKPILPGKNEMEQARMWPLVAAACVCVCAAHVCAPWLQRMWR
jgi:cyclin-dependent kinase 12/13